MTPIYRAVTTCPAWAGSSSIGLEGRALGVSTLDSISREEGVGRGTAGNDQILVIPKSYSRSLSPVAQRGEGIRPKSQRWSVTIGPGPSSLTLHSGLPRAGVLGYLSIFKSPLKCSDPPGGVEALGQSA